MTDHRELRLGLNVDHVATIRNARGGTHPCPVEAAKLAERAGADGITAHLREDRRHVKDEDMRRLKAECGLPLNFEMAATDEMQKIALSVLPHAVCLVPESRHELTTEGGLNVVAGHNALSTFIPPLQAADIRVSLFIDPEEAQIRAAKEVGADVVELHTGSYANVEGAERAAELQRLQAAAKLADELGLEVHAGHGLTFDNVEDVAAIPEIVELNIGHFIVGDAVFHGLEKSIHTMMRHMNKGRFGE